MKRKHPYISNFTVIANTLMDDKRLGYKEVGMFLRLWKLPDDWQFSINGIQAVYGGAKGSICNIIKTLVECGYIEKEPVYNDNHRFVRYEYILNDIPDISPAILKNRIPKNGIPENDHNKVLNITSSNNKERNNKRRSGQSDVQTSGDKSSFDVSKRDHGRFVKENKPVVQGQWPTEREFKAWLGRLCIDKGLSETVYRKVLMSFMVQDLKTDRNIGDWKAWFGAVAFGKSVSKKDCADLCSQDNVRELERCALKHGEIVSSKETVVDDEWQGAVW